VPPRPVPDRLPPGDVMHKVRLPPDWPRAQVLFTDHQWRTATIVAWCRHRSAWAALIRWADGTEDWLHYDPRYLQRSVEYLGGWSEE
jgi:hypothetical protein